MRIQSLITAVLSLLFAHSVMAQVGDPRRDVAVGVSAGVSINSVSFHPAVSQTMKMSPTYGLTIRYNCEKYFKSLCGIQGEVNFCNLGWKENFKETLTPDYHYTRNMNYLTVPIMARMAWGREQKGLMFFVLAGPQFGLCISDKEDMSDELHAEDVAIPVSRRAQYGKAIEKKFDYGITAGLGVELNTRHAGHYLIDARYYLGLADIFNNGKADYFGRSANNTIVVRFTYLYDVMRTKRLK